MTAAAILKNRKIAISRPRFNRFLRNLARWCISNLLTVPIVKNLKFLQIQDGCGRHLENLKIAISQPQFERFRQNLVRWCSSTLLSVPTVKNFKNPRWPRPPSWKIEKSLYLSRGSTDFDAIGHDGAFRTSWPSRSSKIWNFANPIGGRHPNNLKITISWQRFDQPSDFSVFT